MKFTPIDIKNCLDTAQTLREIYFFNRNFSDTHVSVNALLHIVQKNYDKKVILSFHEDSHEAHFLYSFLNVNGDGSYHICLMSGMTNCWNRFALCKELFHVILDEENARNPSLIEHLQDFRAAMRDSDTGGRVSSKSEVLTEFAAMQFLFPYAKRLECLTEIEAREKKGEMRKNIFEGIARRLRMPRLLTEDYLEQESIDLFGAISWNEKSDCR